MSSVRMCDSCGTIFSEREDGWATQSATITKRDPETGKPRSVTLDLDKCGDCTELEMNRPARPRLELTADVNPTYVAEAESDK